MNIKALLAVFVALTFVFATLALYEGTTHYGISTTTATVTVVSSPASVLASTVGCQRAQTYVWVGYVAEMGQGVYSTVTATSTLSTTTYQNTTSISAPPGTVVITTSLFATTAGQVISNWVAQTCTYVK